MKNEKIYLEHILEAIKSIKKYTKGMNLTEFFRNSLVQDAVIRQLEIIGEASKNITTEIRKELKEIPWKEISGMRNKLIHEYFGIDINVVWETAKNYLPPLEKQIKDYLKN